MGVNFLYNLFFIFGATIKELFGSLLLKSGHLSLAVLFDLNPKNFTETSPVTPSQLCSRKNHTYEQTVRM